MWPSATLRPGYLWQDGTVYNIADYPALFAAIGAVYGGDGVTTFAVPDMRGRTPVGLDNLGGSAAGRVGAAWASTLGGVGGEEKHANSQSENAAHQHQQTVYEFGGGPRDLRMDYINGAQYGSALATGVQGNSSAHNVMQPGLACGWIIKY